MLFDVLSIKVPLNIKEQSLMCWLDVMWHVFGGVGDTEFLLQVRDSLVGLEDYSVPIGWTRSRMWRRTQQKRGFIQADTTSLVHIDSIHRHVHKHKNHKDCNRPSFAFYLYLATHRCVHRYSLRSEQINHVFYYFCFWGTPPVGSCPTVETRPSVKTNNCSRWRALI